MLRRTTGVGGSVGNDTAMGFRALGPASVAALILGIAVYLVEGSVLGAISLAAGVTAILLVLLGFPELANRPLWGRPVAKGRRIRRSLITLAGFGALVLAAGLLLDSTGLLLLALGYFAFWFLLVTFGHRHG
jgi:hypothetical protein